MQTHSHAVYQGFEVISFKHTTATAVIAATSRVLQEPGLSGREDTACRVYGDSFAELATFEF